MEYLTDRKIHTDIILFCKLYITQEYILHSTNISLHIWQDYIILYSLINYRSNVNIIY